MNRIVFLPGLATDGELFAAQIAALPEGWQAEVSDAHTRHTRIEAMAEAVLREHDGPLVLCGASMGGMIAMEAARQAPQRLRGLALLGTTARPETPEMQALREAAIEQFQAGRVREVLDANVAFAFHPEHAADAALIERYVALVMRAGAGQLVRQNRAVIARPDARLHLPALRCPTLVLCGEADPLTPPECAREIAALVPGSEMVMVAGAGHMLTLEQPARVGSLLAGWLTGLPAT